MKIDMDGIDSNICSVIAAQIIAGYYDSFCDDNVIDDQYDYVSVGDISETKSSDWKNWDFVSGCGCIGNNNYIHDEGYNKKDSRFRDYLVERYDIVNNSNIKKKGASLSGLRAFTKNYYNSRSVKYECTTCEGNLSDLLKKRAKSFIKNCIDQGYPVIANGYSHSTVIFAYDDNYAYLVDGWGGIRKTVWGTYTDWGTFGIPSALCVKMDYHSHNDNYYSSSTKKFYCSCGFARPTVEIPIKKDMFNGGVDNISSNSCNIEQENVSCYGSTLKLVKDSYLKFSFKTNSSEQVKRIALNVSNTFDGRTYSSLSDQYFIKVLDSSKNVLCDYSIRGYLVDSYAQKGWFAINFPPNAFEFIIYTKNNNSVNLVINDILIGF